MRSEADPRNESSCNNVARFTGCVEFRATLQVLGLLSTGLRRQADVLSVSDLGKALELTKCAFSNAYRMPLAPRFFPLGI
jgi:hypothetical protein